MTTKTRFSEMEMNAAFKCVQHPDDWREPIDVVLRITSTYMPEEIDREMDLIQEAIEFYTATVPTIHNLHYGRIHIQKERTMTTKTRFSEMEMNAAFKRVQNPNDWRGLINAIIQVDSQKELDLITEAIMFYTATKATVTRISNAIYGRVYRVTAAGYRAGPAGP